MAVALDEIEVSVRRRILELEIEKREAATHPASFLDRVQCLDAKTGERFQFHLNDPTSGWYWQRALLEDWLSHDRNIVYKARQIGITWLAAGLGLWYCVFQPFARVLVVSTNEVEAIKVVNRIWDMWLSLPDHLKNDRTIVKPSRGARPTTEIQFMAPDGSISSIIAMPATETAGHGETATLVILDEYSRQEYAAGTWKSTFPTIDGGGRVVVISTANGVSNPNTGEGNYFHYLWVNRDTLGIRGHFLPWSLHPDRDQHWYENNANALPPMQRAEQYPTNEEDGFINTGLCAFDLESLNYYVRKNRAEKREPLYRMKFRELPGKAKIDKVSNGPIWIYEEPPNKDRRYAIGADPATGQGDDFSSAHVIDLHTMQFVATYHASIDPDLFATDLFYLGRMYNDALLGVENQGGYGYPVIIALRDQRNGRPAYRNLYRSRREDRASRKDSENYGVVMTPNVRSQVINDLEASIRERDFEYFPDDLAQECRTFVHKKKGTSPRAEDGCNDDRVMSAAIACELYRQKGYKRLVRKKKAKKQSWRDAVYDWEQ